VVKGETTFPINQKCSGDEWGVLPKYWGPHGVFLIFHELLSKGGCPSSKEMVNVGCWLSKGGLSKLEIIFPT
jgi:hypothetical protein